MMVRLLLILAAVGTAAVAVPAAAQLAPGISGISGAPRQGNADDYWYLIRQMGDCLAGTKEEQSIAFLATRPGTKGENAAFKKLFGRSYNGCMKTFVSASFLRAHLRGSLAEGLYQRNAAKLGEGWVPQGDAPATIKGIHDFAACYVASHYPAARSLLMDTRLATREEREAVIGMAGDFGKCLPEGSNVELNAVDVRLALAEAMYRATLAPPAREGAL